MGRYSLDIDGIVYAGGIGTIRNTKHLFPTNMD